MNTSFREETHALNLSQSRPKENVSSLNNSIKSQSLIGGVCNSKHSAVNKFHPLSVEYLTGGEKMHSLTNASQKINGCDYPKSVMTEKMNNGVD